MRVLAVGLGVKASNARVMGASVSDGRGPRYLKNPVKGKRENEYQLAVILADVLLCRRLAGTHVQSYNVRKIIISL